MSLLSCARIRSHAHPQSHELSVLPGPNNYQIAKRYYCVLVDTMVDTVVVASREVGDLLFPKRRI